MPKRTRSLACNERKHASKSPQVRRTIRHSLRDGFRLMARSPRGAGLDSPRHFTRRVGPVRADIANLAKLDLSVGRPGPHAFAVRERPGARLAPSLADRKSTRLNSSHPSISYAVFCLKKKK